MADENRWTIIGACVTTFMASVSLVGSYVTIILNPINQDILELKRDIANINTTMAPLLTLYAQHKSDEERFTSFQSQIDTKMDKNVHEVFATMLTTRLDSLVLTDTERVNEIQHQVHDLESSIVSRQENTVHWAATDALALRVNALGEHRDNEGKK
jgi:hypothetical protein